MGAPPYERVEVKARDYCIFRLPYVSHFASPGEVFQMAMTVPSNLSLERETANFVRIAFNGREMQPERTGRHRA